MLAGVCLAEATEYVTLPLHHQVQSSDVIVIARVVDPSRAVLAVERVFKGEPPKQITLVDYIDLFAAPAERKPLNQDARELLFLKRQGDAHAPLNERYGRWPVDGDRLIDSSRSEPRRLSAVTASIESLVILQARAARGGVEADRAYVAAFGNADAEVQKWGTTAVGDIKVPSPALVDAFLDYWSKDAGAVAGGVMAWRLRQAAPVLAKTLTESADGDERAFAAMALGGTGDREYLPLLRKTASSDTHPQARALAYRGIVWMIGPDSLGDLRRGAKDADEKVRAQTVVDAYNMLQLSWSEPFWPRASDTLVAEVRAFLNGMLSDPASHVRTNAKSMLFMIAKHRP